MNSPQLPTETAVLGHKAQGRNWTRRLVNVLVALVVIAVAGAAFVFSYDGVHAIALVGGVSTQLARYYPGLFDAVLVIACVAAVMLRGGRWWARLWAWLVIVIVLGAIGAADVLHAMDYTLRHRPTEGVVAAAPAVAVLLAFSLLLTLLRQPRTPPPAPETPPDLPALPVSVAPIALPAAPGTSPLDVFVDGAEPQDAVTEPTATVPAPAVPMPPAATATAPAAATVTSTSQPAPAPEDVPVPDIAPTRPDPVLDTPVETARYTVPGDAALPDAAPEEEAYPPTAPTAVIGTAPTAEAPAMTDEPAPPTVEVAAVAPSRVPPRPPSIRYAGDDIHDTPPSADYWDTEDTAEFAGLIYPARDDADDDTGTADTAANGPAERPAERKVPPELDDDAPPFATAPFASVPRLNRVRSTPTPPSPEDE